MKGDVARDCGITLTTGFGKLHELTTRGRWLQEARFDKTDHGTAARSVADRHWQRRNMSAAEPGSVHGSWQTLLNRCNAAACSGKRGGSWALPFRQGLAGWLSGKAEGA